MGFPVSEVYSLPMNAKSLVGSVMGKFLREPLPAAHVADGGVHQECDNLQGLFGEYG